MKFYRKDLIILMVLLAIAGIACLLPQANSTIDIQMVDVYIVFDSRTLILWMMGILMFAIFLTRAIATGFKSVVANHGLLIGLIILGWMIIGISLILRNTPIALPDDIFLTPID